ncbi:MAG: hypothetical protein Q8N79_00950 [Candidatus Methanoperedens sp.]|nr:hypothetical protein [Candidatus Methanoperedens sp.]
MIETVQTKEGRGYAASIFIGIFHTTDTVGVWHYPKFEKGFNGIFKKPTKP